MVMRGMTPAVQAATAADQFAGATVPSRWEATRTPLCGFRYRLRTARGVDQDQSREQKMSALTIIRNRAKKVINLEAARKLMARRQLAGA